MSNLLSPDDLMAYIEADDTAARQQFRAMFRRSWFLVSKILVGWNEERNLMDVGAYKDRQDWLQWIYTDVKRGLLEDPRSFIKTTGHTRTAPIWIGIQRPHPDYDADAEIKRAEAFLIKYPHIKGVDSKFLLCGDTEANATRFAGSIKTIFATNPFLRWCFPELCWPTDRPNEPNARWADGAFHLPGRLMPEEPNPFLRAAGADTAIVGGRAGFVIFNDLVGDHNWRSATEMQRLREFISTAPSMLADRDPKSPNGGVVVIEGNRWSLDDVNTRVHDEFTDWEIWRRGVYVCTSHGRGNCGRWGSESAKTCAPTNESLWTGRYPDGESLARLQRDVGNPEVWAAQYLNDPRVAADFDENNIKDFHVDLRVFRGDSGISREWCVIIPSDGGEEVLPLATLDSHIISVDPAASDEPNAARTAISWFARDKHTGRRFWLECVAGRWRADAGEVEPRILDLYKTVLQRTGKKPKIIVEKVAAQGYLASALKNLALNDKLQLGEVEMVKPAKGSAKDDRIRRRVGFIASQGLLYVRSGLQLPRTEVRHFPTGTKDALDTCAQAEEIFLALGGFSIDSDKMRAARARRRLARIQFAGRTGAVL